MVRGTVAPLTPHQCIIMVKKKEQVFDPMYIEKMYDAGNKDGFGMMWCEKVENVWRVKFEKSMGGWKELEKIYATKMDNDMAVHLRNATFGEKDIENCHPYCVLDIDLGHPMDLYMMHNGTIREVQVDKKMSDSYNFATKFLRGYILKHPNVLQDEAFQLFLAGVIGPNKLVFLDSKKRFTIINSDMGAIHPTGVWISNKNDLKPYEYRTKPPEPVETIIKTHQSIPQGAWKFSKGDWVESDDGRLHFQAEPEVLSKSENEQAESTTDEATKKTVGIDNGIQVESNDVDEEGLNEIIIKLPNMKELDVFEFVNSYHAESFEILKKLSNQDPNKIKLMIAADPWETSQLLIKLAKEKFVGNNQTNETSNLN